MVEKQMTSGKDRSPGSTGNRSPRGCQGHTLQEPFEPAEST